MADRLNTTLYALTATDLKYLEWLMTRTYSERRMSGDDMRDIGNRLRVMLDDVIPLPDAEIEKPTK